MTAILLNRSTADSHDVLIRAVIYLLVAVSALRGLFVYNQIWQTLLLVIVPFMLILACEGLVKRQSLPVKLLYILLQVSLLPVLYLLAPLADYWAILLLPACYFAMQHFALRFSYLLIALLTVVMALSLWRAEGGLDSLLYSSIYAVAYLMVAAFSRIVLQLVQSRNNAEALSLQLEQANQRLRDYAERAASIAILEERSAVARELHDSVTQTLFSVNLLLNSLENKYPEQPVALRNDIDKIASLSEAAMKELRAIITQFKPATENSRTFSAGLGQLIAEMDQTHQLPVQLHYDQTPIPGFATKALLKIIREALFNIVKHAGHSPAVVNIHYASGLLHVSIKDSGKGFEITEQSRTGHLGLENMRLNAIELGATLNIHSTPDHGTQIELTMPSTFEVENESTAINKGPTS